MLYGAHAKVLRNQIIGITIGLTVWLILMRNLYLGDSDRDRDNYFIR